MFSRSPVSSAEKGLVEQHQLRLAGKCAGQCDTLLLAAGQLMRASVEHSMIELDHIHEVANDLAAISDAALDAEADVFGNAQMWK